MYGEIKVVIKIFPLTTGAQPQRSLSAHSQLMLRPQLSKVRNVAAELICGASPLGELRLAAAKA